MSGSTFEVPHGEVIVYEAPDGELRVKDSERFIERAVQ
jgi:hypothetical protein